MQDYSYIYVPVIVLINTGFTPCSHNTKQRRNASGQFLRVGYSYYKQNATLIFRILSVSFCFCKICNNRIFTPDKQSQNSQHRALKKNRKEPDET